MAASVAESCRSGRSHGGRVPAVDAPADPSHVQLEEIVVTAQRRVENLQTVSIAVTSLNGDELNDKAVTASR